MGSLQLYSGPKNPPLELREITELQNYNSLLLSALTVDHTPSPWSATGFEDEPALFPWSFLILQMRPLGPEITE